ncbi:MAG: hypothetical protein LIO57_01685 [Oscillospiraceae bacterium]|nr:hypothetical protein [Oscillospiraceae bacterium]
MASAKIQTGLRLDEKVYGKLKTLSIQEGRSLNNLAEYILKKYLEDYEAKNGELPEHQD